MFSFSEHTVHGRFFCLGWGAGRGRVGYHCCSIMHNLSVLSGILFVGSSWFKTSGCGCFIKVSLRCINLVVSFSQYWVFCFVLSGLAFLSVPLYFFSDWTWATLKIVYDDKKKQGILSVQIIILFKITQKHWYLIQYCHLLQVITIANIHHTGMHAFDVLWCFTGLQVKVWYTP